MDDHHLLDLALQFEPSGLRQLHQRCYPLILRYVQMKVADGAAGQDLTSEVLLRMLNKLKQGQGWHTTPEAWALGIARYVVADFYRDQYRRPQVGLDEQMLTAVQPHLSQQLIDQEQQAQLWQAIQTLTAEQREVIMLRFMAELSLKEVADLLGKRVGAVKGLQYRAIQALATMLTPKV